MEKYVNIIVNDSLNRVNEPLVSTSIFALTTLRWLGSDRSEVWLTVLGDSEPLSSSYITTRFFLYNNMVLSRFYPPRCTSCNTFILLLTAERGPISRAFAGCFCYGSANICIHLPIIMATSTPHLQTSTGISGNFCSFCQDLWQKRLTWTGCFAILCT